MAPRVGETAGPRSCSCDRLRGPQAAAYDACIRDRPFGGRSEQTETHRRILVAEPIGESAAHSRTGQKPVRRPKRLSMLRGNSKSVFLETGQMEGCAASDKIRRSFDRTVPLRLRAGGLVVAVELRSRPIFVG